MYNSHRNLVCRCLMKCIEGMVCLEHKMCRNVTIANKDENTQIKML